MLCDGLYELDYLEDTILGELSYFLSANVDKAIKFCRVDVSVPRSRTGCVRYLKNELEEARKITVHIRPYLALQSTSFIEVIFVPFVFSIYFGVI